MKRRDFVKNSLATTSGVFFVNSVLGNVNPVLKTDNVDELFSGFQDPPIDSRLFVR